MVDANAGAEDRRPRVPRLTKRWLEAGVPESGQWRPVESGTPQGAGVSAILANVFASLRRLSLGSSVEKTAPSLDSDQSAGMQMILDDTLIACWRAAEGAVRLKPRSQFPARAWR